MSEFQKLYEHGKILELLELARNSSTATGKLWEIDALLMLERYEEAKLHLEQYSSNFNHSEDPEIRFNFMHIQGILNTEIGDISVGRTFLEQSVQIAESNKLENVYAFRGLINLGLNYNSTGEFTRAAEIYKKALQYAEGKIIRLAAVNIALGFAHANSNNLPKAAIYFEKGLKQNKEISNGRMMSHALHGLTNAHSWLGNFEKAKGYLEELEELVERTDDHSVIANYKFSKAIFLFNQPRLAAKMSSLELFVELLEEHLVAPSIELWVYWYILELLFGEYRLHKQDLVMQEIKQYLDKYFVTATQYNNVPHITISLITHAQLAGVEGEFEEAEKIISEAITTAEKFGATKFVERASIAKLKLLNEFKQMEILIKQNASLSERLNKSNLIDYIKNAQDLIGTASSNE